MTSGGRLAQRVALVTGGGGEIGGAICRRFAAEGAAVAVADLDPAKSEAVARAIAGSVTPDGTVETLSLDDWNKAIAVNLTGAFVMCKYAVPALRRAGGGSII